SINTSTQESKEEVCVTIGSLAQARNDSGHSLGRRLLHLGSVPHRSRVNGEIPNVDNATLDHERLLERLGTYGLAEFQIEGDGNCQFRALSDQIFRNPEYHKQVRKEVMKQLKEFRKRYEGYVPMEYKVYLKKMKRSGEWGDHLTLQAGADRPELQRFKTTFMLELCPRGNNKCIRHIFVALPLGSYWCKAHEETPCRKAIQNKWIFKKTDATVM
ncbi:hypothetical protein ZWY2020_039813, partial [Hordeum vulgare]